MSGQSEKERVRKAKELAGISRATDFRQKKELENDGQLPTTRPRDVKGNQANGQLPDTNLDDSGEVHEHGRQPGETRR
jgi:hypothetical protein